MIQARAGGVAGAGEADGMDEHACFHAEFGGHGFQRGFQGGGVEWDEQGVETGLGGVRANVVSAVMDRVS